MKEKFYPLIYLINIPKEILTIIMKFLKGIKNLLNKSNFQELKSYD
jgi:hypothetical protein